MRFAGLAVLAALTATPALAADPVGSYAVEGTNPGGNGRYRGTVTVMRTGETYRVTWQIGNTRYVGTAIGTQDLLAVTYLSGGSTGLALYGPDSQGWTGSWTNMNGTTVGGEHWVRQ